MNSFNSWISNWFKLKNWKPQNFQLDTWGAVLDGNSGLVNAPTGSGKTLSLFPPIIWPHINKDKINNELLCLWITPLRSLSQQIKISIEEFITENNLNLTVAIRNGDTPPKIRNQQRKKLPNILITTPESLQLLISSKNWSKKFSSLSAIVVDEWHELLGSKRGVQTELCIGASSRYS